MTKPRPSQVPDLGEDAEAQKARETVASIKAYVAAHRGRERITRQQPDSEFPELLVTVPDTWDSVQLAPLYDVHIGNDSHDATRFDRHLRWIRETPNVLTWNGGDLVENANKESPGASVHHQDARPQVQMVRAIKRLTHVAHKMLFSLPGNHEARTEAAAGVSIGEWMSGCWDVPYFPDYCFCTIKWRGNNFRILAHHGTGASVTAGAQRMAARKDIAWARPFDLFWTGHLHSALVDVLYQTDFDQRTGRAFERTGLVVISPSYVKYFGTYAAAKRCPPGHRGLTAVILREDGRIDTSVFANGRRL